MIMAQSILTLEIHAYTCLTDSERKCIAMIDGVSMVFKGDTPMQAALKADEWRRYAVEGTKYLTKAQKAKLLGEAAK